MCLYTPPKHYKYKVFRFSRYVYLIIYFIVDNVTECTQCTLEYLQLAVHKLLCSVFLSLIFRCSSLIFLRSVTLCTWLTFDVLLFSVECRLFLTILCEGSSLVLNLKNMFLRFPCDFVTGD